MCDMQTLIVELNDAVNWENEAEDIDAVDKVLIANDVRYCGWDGCTDKQPSYKSGADALINDFSDFEYLDYDCFKEL